MYFALIKQVGGAKALRFFIVGIDPVLNLRRKLHKALYVVHRAVRFCILLLFNLVTKTNIHHPLSFVNIF